MNTAGGKYITNKRVDLRSTNKSSRMIKTFIKTSPSPDTRQKSESTFANSIDLNSQSVFDNQQNPVQRNFFYNQSPNVAY